LAESLQSMLQTSLFISIFSSTFKCRLECGRFFYIKSDKEICGGGNLINPDSDG
jgi:hypothetical protein